MVYLATAVTCWLARKCRYKEADLLAYFVYVKWSGDAVAVVLSPANFAVLFSHLAVHKSYELSHNLSVIYVLRKGG